MSRGMDAHGCEEAVAAMNRPETHRRRRIELADELGSAASWWLGIFDFRPYGPQIARRRGGGWSLGSVEGPGDGGFGWRQLDARLGWLHSLRVPRRARNHQTQQHRHVDTARDPRRRPPPRRGQATVASRVAAWVLRSRVLFYPAAAIFVSECGWSSALESVASGVPMVAWSVDAEHRMNATVLSEGEGVTLRLGAGPQVVGCEEVVAAVREQMEGRRATPCGGGRRSCARRRTRHQRPRDRLAGH
jgi:hydroquinone glucosyltransferase